MIINWNHNPYIHDTRIILSNLQRSLLLYIINYRTLISYITHYIIIRDLINQLESRNDLTKEIVIGRKKKIT
jgi:hypothetical protein